ncbi:leucine-rich repeat-containing protein 36 isoform X2 [Oxyura jamaicensis]|uniref:leucine-rich repeat-containing protein 36 isoform X2 n=1 Tax=Oxyura jamaicensis TaxID=8884 RepID=UPI0015A5F475|nr:leucine-rich repeat-containing protein 36 isoform X2 [Oxyura jamaicensis]
MAAAPQPAVPGNGREGNGRGLRREPPCPGLEADQSSCPQLRSSLHTPEKMRAGGLHVVFSDSKTSNSSPETDTIQKSSISELSQDISSTKRLNLSDTNTNNSNKSSRDARLSNFDDFYHVSVTSSPQHGHPVQKPQSGKRNEDHRDYGGRLPTEMKTSSQTASGSTLTQLTETEIKHRSPLNIKSGFRDATSLSAEVLLENLKSIMTKSAMLSSVPGKVREPAAHRSSSPARVEYKRSETLHSPISPNHCFKDSHKESSSSELSNDTAVTEGQSATGSEKESKVTAVLQQLLKLVDCHWNGPGSLLVNKDFLVPAQNLLFHLVACTAPQQDAHLTAGHCSSVLSKNNPKVQRTQLKYTQQFDRMDSAAQGKGLVESHVSASTLHEMDHTAASSYHIQRNQASMYDELLWKNNQLSTQVEFLRLEVKQLTGLQEMVALLQESQRSLVSTNNFLLQQLSKGNSHTVHKTPLPSEKCTSRETSSPLERTASVPSVYSSSQYWSSEQLCNCPL